MDECWTTLNEKMEQMHVSMVKHFDRLIARQCYFEVIEGRALTILAENAGIDLEKFPDFLEYSWEVGESSGEDESEHVSKVQPEQLPVSPGHQKDPDYNPDEDGTGKND